MTIAFLLIAGTDGGANCPPSSLNDWNTLQYQIEVRQFGPSLVQAVPPPESTQDQAQSILRVESWVHVRTEAIWSAFMRLSLWVESWHRDGIWRWSPCAESWIWAEGTREELQQEWPRLQRRLHNELQSNRSPHASISSPFTGPPSVPCPMAGYCPSQAMPSPPPASSLSPSTR